MSVLTGDSTTTGGDTTYYIKEERIVYRVNRPTLALDSYAKALVFVDSSLWLDGRSVESERIVFAPRP